jgi:homoserine dehydrogenase
VGALPVNVAVIGSGTVGQWLLRAIGSRREALRARHGIDLRVVAVAGRDGLVSAPGGIDLDAALALRRAGAPVTGLPGVQRWPSVLEAIAGLELDVVAEVTQSLPPDGEPGRAHISAALSRGIAVATSNKWPVALAGVELAALGGTRFRAESTVMSGTPVLSALTGGLGGAMPLRLRGVLNATVGVICARLEAGASYADALAEAQAAGLAERDPSADVDGLDAVAKVMVLSALVFGEQLALGDVTCSGLADFAARLDGAPPGGAIREVATLDPGAGRRSVEVRVVDEDDPVAAVSGAINCVRLEADPLGVVTITGPGAGPELAGLGVFSDVVALARQCAAGAVP